MRTETARERVERRIQELSDPGDIGVTGMTINRLLVQELDQVLAWMSRDPEAPDA